MDDSGISENHQFRLHYQKQRYLIIHFAYFFIEIQKQLVFGTTLDLQVEKNQNFQIPTAPLKLSSFNCSFEIEAFLNIGTKLDLTGGVRLTEFLGIFFGWFQLSFKNKSMVPDGFATKVGGFGWFRSFLVVLGDFSSFRGVTCFVLYDLNQNIEKTNKVREKK